MGRSVAWGFNTPPPSPLTLSCMILKYQGHKKAPISRGFLCQPPFIPERIFMSTSSKIISTINMLTSYT